MGLARCASERGRRPIFQSYKVIAVETKLSHAQETRMYVDKFPTRYKITRLLCVAFLKWVVGEGWSMEGPEGLKVSESLECIQYTLTLWLWISKESLTFEGLDSLKIVRCFTGEIWRSGGQSNVGCGVDRL